MSIFDDYHPNVQSAAIALEKLVKQKEELLLQQLNWLVSRGLLIIEEGPMSLVTTPGSYDIQLKQTVELVVKDKEYIEKLEKENNTLKLRLLEIREVFDKLSSNSSK